MRSALQFTVRNKARVYDEHKNRVKLTENFDQVVALLPRFQNSPRTNVSLTDVYGFFLSLRAHANIFL
jgi:hypothetical protein